MEWTPPSTSVRLPTRMGLEEAGDGARCLHGGVEVGPRGIPGAEHDAAAGTDVDGDEPEGSVGPRRGHELRQGLLGVGDGEEPTGEQPAQRPRADAGPGSAATSAAAHTPNRRGVARRRWGSPTPPPTGCAARFDGRTGCSPIDAWTRGPRCRARNAAWRRPSSRPRCRRPGRRRRGGSRRPPRGRAGRRRGRRCPPFRRRRGRGLWSAPGLRAGRADAVSGQLVELFGHRPAEGDDALAGAGVEVGEELDVVGDLVPLEALVVERRPAANRRP